MIEWYYFRPTVEIPLMSQSSEVFNFPRAAQMKEGIIENRVEMLRIKHSEIEGSEWSREICGAGMALPK